MLLVSIKGNFGKNMEKKKKKRKVTIFLNISQS